MVEITHTFTHGAYRRCCNEDGAYDVLCGYNLFAVSKEVDGYTETYVYVGPDGKGKGAVSFDSATADFLADRIGKGGSINADAYWECIGRDYVDELPDYVTHWYRPEFN